MNYKINWYRYFGFITLGIFLQLLFDVETNMILSSIKVIAFMLLSVERTNK